MTPHYHINLFWSAEDESWIADVPDLKHCSAHGPSPEAAAAEVAVAIALFVESLEADGLPVPEPRYRPAHHGTRAA
ncbi:type II toxin-antitoxin system HicB family antitoxin [Blastomonas sp.]|uniref:type II toxin-antitoxin system HicB family antitoxin n=1 Tax=Blastomonas sp. TaxID=1909299 RepID=UPI00359483D2